MTAENKPVEPSIVVSEPTATDVPSKQPEPTSSTVSVAPTIPTETVEIKQPTSKAMKEMDIHPAEHLAQEPSRKQFAVLDNRDIRKLTANGYDKAKETFKNVYLIRHKKTGKMAEIRAASSVHAANLLGWNPKKVQVLLSREDGKEPITPGPIEPPKTGEQAFIVPPANIDPITAAPEEKVLEQPLPNPSADPCCQSNT